ncbi:MAG: O-succinylbenzoate synthase [Actinobacteria bacterium]|nr:O-succinylbenzoate synthase [Actinomycetota bacterium]
MQLEEVLTSLRVIELPLRSKFQGLTKREVALFQGKNGWAEFSPFTEYNDQESKKWLDSAIETATKSFQVIRSEIPINGTIPDSENEQEIAELVESYDGAKVFKVKVGRNLQSDLVRLARVSKYSPSAKLRIDVNGLWTVPDAIHNIRAICDQVAGNLEYVEQPVATIDELRELRAELEINVKIAVDEALRKSNAPLDLNLKGAADILILKVAPLGGIAKSLEIGERHKLPLVVSSALESAVGITHGLTLAAALPDISYACGLATGKLFAEDIAQHEISGGNIRVAKPEIDEDRLTRFTVSKGRLEWWRQRITRVWEVAP